MNQYDKFIIDLKYTIATNSYNEIIDFISSKMDSISTLCTLCYIDYYRAQELFDFANKSIYDIFMIRQIELLSSQEQSCIVKLLNQFVYTMRNEIKKNDIIRFCNCKDYLDYGSIIINRIQDHINKNILIISTKVLSIGFENIKLPNEDHPILLYDKFLVMLDSIGVIEYKYGNKSVIKVLKPDLITSVCEIINKKVKSNNE